jgi:hypothetical protein
MKVLNKMWQGIIYETPKFHISTPNFHTYALPYKISAFPRKKVAVHPGPAQEVQQQSFAHPSPVV